MNLFQQIKEYLSMRTEVIIQIDHNPKFSNIFASGSLHSRPAKRSIKMP